MLNLGPLQAFLLQVLGAAIIFVGVGMAIRSGKGQLSGAFSAGAGVILALAIAALGMLVMGSQTDIGQRVLATLGLVPAE